MKKTTSLSVSTALLLSAVVALNFMSCSGGTNYSGGGSGSSGEESTATAQADVTTLSPGTTVEYNGEQYFVVKNSFYKDTSTASADLLSLDVTGETNGIKVVAETDEQLKKNIEYIKKYLDKDFQAKLIKEKLEITEYLELFKKSTKKEESAKGYASLEDIYYLLDSAGKKIGEVNQKWQSTGVFSRFLGGASGTEAMATAFNSLTEDEIREYDPFVIVVQTKNSDKNLKYELQYNYYDVEKGDANYGKINTNDLHNEIQSFGFMENAAGKKVYSYRIQKNANVGNTRYGLIDPFSGSSGLRLEIIDGTAQTIPKFYLDVSGEGKINGSNKTSIYQKQVESFYFTDTPTRVLVTLGDSKTSQISVKGDSSYSGTLRITNRTSTDGGNTWTDGDTSEVDFDDIGNNCDFMSVSSETMTVSADGSDVVVPASITYYAHYPKNADGTYPPMDKYAQITCYPVYATYNGTSRIVYKVTEKSIADFLKRYQDDFSKLTE